MDTNISQTTYTDLDGEINDYQVSHATIDEAETKEYYWNNPKCSEYLGYYKSIPEFKEALRALARWTVGKGYKTDVRTEVLLSKIIGWGEDSFQSILTNLVIIKKVNGDSFAEIIRNDKGTLINLKPLNPGKLSIVTNSKGFIERYEEYRLGADGSRQVKRTFQPNEILHLCNDRIGNEIHGTSALEAVKWVLDARNEAMTDWRRISHRSTIRVLYVDSDDTTKLNTLKEQYAEAIKYGEVMILPGKKGDAELEDYSTPPIQPFIEWIRYTEGFIYQALGVPKPIANAENFTEAGSKVGYLTFEPVYTEEQTLLEQDLWNQLAIRVKFNKPPSLSGVMNEDEEKNTGQTGFQPNESQLNMQRSA